ncbi:MAG: TolC family protein [Desulfobacterales bacterium]
MQQRLTTARRRRFFLTDFYRLALERSESIKIARNQLSVAEQDVDRAFSALLPNLSAYGDYIRYENESRIQPKSGREIGVKLQQQFSVNGREFIILGAAKDTIKEREYDLDAVTEENLFTVATAYYDIVNKRKRLEIAEENVVRLEAHKKAVVTRLRLEDVPKTALLRTEAELSGARSDLVQAKMPWRLLLPICHGCLKFPWNTMSLCRMLREKFSLTMAWKNMLKQPWNGARISVP